MNKFKSIKNITIEMEDGSTKTFDVLDSMILAVCKNDDPDNTENNIVISQISDNTSLQLSMLKNIIRYEPAPQQSVSSAEDEEEIVVEDDEPLIEVIDEE